MEKINTYLLGKWVVDPSLNQLQWDSEVRHLEPRAMDVLVHLMDRPEAVVSTDELLRHYWTVHTAEPRKIAKKINQIRKALDDDARNPTYIETIPKRGYRVVAAVSFQSTGMPLSPSRGDMSAAAAVAEALANMGTPDYFEKWLPNAIEQLQGAISQNVRNADAWSHLALLHALSTTRAGVQDFRECADAARYALSIDSKLALPHVALGYVALLGQWDIAGARRSFELALGLSPDDPVALSAYHLLLRIEDKHDAAGLIAERLRLAAPTDIRFRVELGKLNYETRLYEKAISASEDVRNTVPGYVDFSEAAALHAVGRFTDSYQARLAAYRLLGDAGKERLAALESGWSSGGYTAALQALSDLQLSMGAGSEGLAPREFLFLSDRPERLLKLLQCDVEQRRPAMIGLLHNPEFDALRVYPAFQKILDQVVSKRPTDSPAKQADVARLQIFRGQARAALPNLQRLLNDHENDRLTQSWMESMAWGCYALEDHEKALYWSLRVLELDCQYYTRTRVQLIECACMAAKSQSAPAKRALRAALKSWPSTLDLNGDIAPLFFGGDKSLESRFLSAVNRVLASVESY